MGGALRAVFTGGIKDACSTLECAMIRLVVAVVRSRNIDWVIFSPSSGEAEKENDPATAQHTHPAKDEAVTKLNNSVTYGGRGPGEAQYIVVSKRNFEFRNSLKTRGVRHPQRGITYKLKTLTKNRVCHPPPPPTTRR